MKISMRKIQRIPPYADPVGYRSRSAMHLISDRFPLSPVSLLHYPYSKFYSTITIVVTIADLEDLHHRPRMVGFSVSGIYVALGLQFKHRN
jgi:hypothetical protein